jgi:O-antigen ligase
MTKQYQLILFSFFFFLFVAIIFYTPSFGSYDIIGPQWFLYSLLNLLVFIVAYRKITFESFKLFYRPIFIKSLTFFFILSIFSILYADNKFLVAHDLSRFGTFFLSIFLFFIVFHNKLISVKYLIVLFYIILFFELVESLKPFALDYFLYGLDIFNIADINLSLFKGIAGNKNITAASIVTKLPLTLYLLTRRELLIKLTATLFIFFQFLVLFLLSARASFLSLGLILLFFIFYLIFNFFSKRHYIYSALLLLLSLTSSFIFSTKILPASLSVANRSSSINLSNESSSNRFVLWSNAIDHISNHPLIGTGFGSWKVESIKYWGNIGDNYLIPYHAHNDVLEFSAELGVLGGVLYLFLFFSLFFNLSKMYLKTKSIFTFMIILYLFGYLVDMLLNFPSERPIMQVPLALILAFSANMYINSKSLNNV